MALFNKKYVLELKQIVLPQICAFDLTSYYTLCGQRVWYIDGWAVRVDVNDIDLAKADINDIHDKLHSQAHTKNKKAAQNTAIQAFVKSAIYEKAFQFSANKDMFEQNTVSLSKAPDENAGIAGLVSGLKKYSAQFLPLEARRGIQKEVNKCDFAPLWVCGMTE